MEAIWLGREVVAHTGGPGGSGGYAELAAVDLESCAPVPPGVDLRTATRVLHDGSTALRVLETTGADAGEWVLAPGAAGGMGTFWISPGRRKGRTSSARPVGPRNREVVSQQSWCCQWWLTTAKRTGPTPSSPPPKDEVRALPIDGVGGQICGQSSGS